MRWNDVQDPPDDERLILLSFSNYPFVGIGRYREDDEGGAYYSYYSDEIESSLISRGFVVNGWADLPAPRRDDEL